MDTEKELETLKSDLQKVSNLNSINFGEAKMNEKPCIYIVIDEQDTVIYIGKTSRTGKLRLREMGADFRSHTLNRKLLKIKINKKIKPELKSLTNYSKKQLIESGIVKESKFKESQREVNERIKQKFMFKILPIRKERLTQVEHFLIAIYNPKFND